MEINEAEMTESELATLAFLEGQDLRNTRDLHDFLVSEDATVEQVRLGCRLSRYPVENILAARKDTSDENLLEIVNEVDVEAIAAIAARPWPLSSAVIQALSMIGVGQSYLCQRADLDERLVLELAGPAGVPGRYVSALLENYPRLAKQIDKACDRETRDLIKLTTQDDLRPNADGLSALMDAVDAAESDFDLRMVVEVFLKEDLSGDGIGNWRDALIERINRSGERDF